MGVSPYFSVLLTNLLINFSAIKNVEEEPNLEK